MDPHQNDANCLSPAKLEAEVLGIGTDQERMERRRHLAACAECATELELMRAFLAAEPSSSEAADVDWIAGNLTPVPQAKPEHERAGALDWLRELLRPGVWAPAAAALAGLAVFVLWDGPPDLPAGLGSGPVVVRSGSLQVVGPNGEVDVPPATLAVEPGASAASYRFSIRAVDDAVLWQADSATASVSLDEQASSLVLPGRTLWWSATALDETGSVVAETEPTQFYLRVGGDSE